MMIDLPAASISENKEKHSLNRSVSLYKPKNLIRNKKQWLTYMCRSMMPETQTRQTHRWSNVEQVLSPADYYW